ncbi:O-acyltransferase like protein-like [Agrilus planipennis]|uniref:O-acyltransferase like protein-like n=1 Tax=Agrilus planipennis TaxID=224129 RepID=A0A1W4XGR1_AGRPL|nr:O-acyltransferase like protein-like [Agrilus planipennis]
MIFLKSVLLFFLFSLCVKSEDNKYTNGSVPTILAALSSNLLGNSSNNPILEALSRNGTFECLQSVKAIQNGIIKGESWAIQFLDANPSMRAGFFDVFDMAYSHFDECIHILPRTSNISFHGRHCWGALPVSMTNFYKLNTKIFPNSKKTKKETEEYTVVRPLFEGISDTVATFTFCIPSTCEPEPMQNALREILSTNITLKSGMCYQDPSLEPLDVAVLGIFAIWFIIIIVATIHDSITLDKKESRIPLLISFSAYANLKYLLKEDKRNQRMYFLNGLKVLSTFTVIFGHRHFIFYSKLIHNKQDLLAFFGGNDTMEIFGLSFSVDTFLVASGFILTLLIQSKLQQGKSMNVVEICVRRYVRLTVPLAAMVLCHVSLLKFVYQVSQWPLLSKLAEKNCKLYWWSCLLYVQNILNPMELCIGQSWYLNVDMQLFYITPLILILLHRFPRRACYGLLGLIVVSTSYTFYVCWKYKIKAYAIGVEGGHESNIYLASYYCITFTRMSPYLIGILVAKFMDRKQPYLNKFTASLLWAVALFLLVVSWIGFQDLIKRQQPYNKLHHSAYNALIRLVWAIGLSIMIHVCYHGYGGIIVNITALFTVD